MNKILVFRTYLSEPCYTLFLTLVLYIVYNKNLQYRIMGTRSGAHSWFNSYAPELVPIFHYRDKTRVQMFYFLNLNLRFNTVSREELQRREIICIYYDHSLSLYLCLVKTKHVSIKITAFNVSLSRSYNRPCTRKPIFYIYEIPNNI